MGLVFTLVAIPDPRLQVAGYGSQDAAVNVSLTAINSLWNLTDFFGRCHTASRPASTAGTPRTIPGTPPPTTPTLFPSPMLVSPAPATPAVGTPLSSGRSVHLAHAGDTGRADLEDADCVEFIMQLFGVFKSLSIDKRPEVRNSGIRTLFLAIGSHGGKCVHACGFAA